MLRQQARQARADAAHAEAQGAGGSFTELQLRAVNQGASLSSEDANSRVSARLRLDRPWRVRAAQEGLHAEHEALRLEGEVEDEESRLALCSESVRARAHALQTQAFADYQRVMMQIGTWVREWQAAGSLDPLAAARTELWVRRHVFEETPDPIAYRNHEGLGLLPEPLSESIPALDLDPARLRQRVLARPQVALHLAGAKQQEALGRSESGARVPWFDFVELGYAIDPNGSDAVQGRVALSIPLDDGSRGRAKKHAGLERSETLAAAGEAAELTILVERNLSVLAAFERDSAELRRLGELSQASESVALRFVDARAERPDQVAQLLHEAYATRMSVLEARTRAGEAACMLAYTTGVGYPRWPRTAP